LSVPWAIQLACELVPHAEETLAVGNPLGAKPVLIDIFEAEVPPNLRGADLFPITHRQVFLRGAPGAWRAHQSGGSKKTRKMRTVTLKPDVRG